MMTPSIKGPMTRREAVLTALLAVTASAIAVTALNARHPSESTRKTERNIKAKPFQLAF